MQHDFWHDKWERMEIGFHLNEENKMLLKYWPQMNVPDGGLVLVPLCGKSLDLIWLHRQGHYVVGIELSELALDQLAEELRQAAGIEISKTRQAERVVYQGEGMLLIAGDFFSVRADDILQMTGQTVAAVYDRAAIVALPDEMRRTYSSHLLQLSDRAPQLLITLDYDQNKRNGPPFAVSDAEVKQHYGQAMTVSVVDERELIDQEPRFREQGLESFIQRVYQLG